MNIKNSLLLFITVLFLSCNSVSNSPEFIEAATGRYLYNSDDVVEVYFEQDELFLNWRGAEKIKPLPVGEQTFYVKEMNKKITFLMNPDDNLYYICNIPKEADSIPQFDFRKLLADEKTPSEFLDASEYDLAHAAFLKIYEKDSLDFLVEEAYMNRFGYNQLTAKNYDKAICIFNANVALYPESSNVYDSLGDAYRRSGDTARAVINYNKSLELDSGNQGAKRQLERLQKKKSD